MRSILFGWLGVMRRIRRVDLARVAVVMGVILLLPMGQAWADTGRLALIIGNADYPEKKLANPINDARAMSQRLLKLGFEVTAAYDLRRRDIGRTVEGFIGRIKPGDTVVVFYAGHGMQIRGENFLPAVDASFDTEYDVTLDSISVGALLSRIDEMRAGVKVLLLDACRNNPYQLRTRSVATRGLAQVGAIAPVGTLISFATRPGGVAEDGEGSNGLYTQGLLKHIDTAGVPVEIMFKRVASSVVELSAGRQEPWVEGSIRGEFSFNPATAVVNASAATSVVVPSDAAQGPGPVASLDTSSAGTRPDVAVSQVPVKQLRSIPSSGWEVLLHEYGDRVTIERLAKLPASAKLKPKGADIAAAATAFSCALQPASRRADGRFSIAGACIANDQNQKATIDISGDATMLRVTQRNGSKPRHDIVLLQGK